jgi:glycine cleavage system aminomethyltransferase T/ketosteroid isomerase-like protein
MPTTMLPRTYTAEQALRAYCDAFERRAENEFADLFADDAVFDLPLHDGRITGKSGILDEIRTAIRGLKNIKVVLEHIIESGSQVFAEGVFYAEHIGIPPHVDGTPMRADFKFVAIVTVANGKVTRWSEYFDTKPLKPRERTHLYPISRRSPYWEGTVQAGVSEFMVYNHTYFPLVYHHSPSEEYAALTERVTLWDVGCERQTELRGPDALRLVEYLTTRDLSKFKVGDCKYTLVCDPEGQIICDPVLLHPWKDVIWLSHGDADLTLWARGIAMHGGFDVEVCEPDVAPLQIQGLKSLDMLRRLVEAPLDDLGFYKCCVTTVAGIQAVVSRTGWSGGLGYEVFPLSSERAMDLWNSLIEAGRPYDLMVTGPNVFRAVEKGVTDTAYYSNSRMNPYEAGHERLVNLEKGDFIGREALRRVAIEGPARKTIGLLIDGELPHLEWYWPLTDARGNDGEVRWAVHSFELKQNIGIAIADANVQVGDRVKISHQAGVSEATVTAIPFV